MVMFAEYCFNKSHSMAYGYVTYQTAYLKAHYPVEYMAALLSSNSGDQEKVQRYIASALSMGIEVLPPDINRSDVDFTPSDNNILFGLTAVRNVGSGPVESILKAREAGGDFKSLADLCDRVDSKMVNKRALEALIYCGSFDTITDNRQQLIKDLELVVDWAQSRAKDRDSGQTNLLDLLSGGLTNTPTKAFDLAPKATPTADFDKPERLRLEKEILGFYISDHPLKALQQSSKILAPIDLSSLKEIHEKTSVSAIIMITTIKPVTTKKGDAMCIIQMEDLTGQSEAVVFPKSFVKVGYLMKPDARLMVWGTVDRRDDQVQFIIDDAQPIESVKMVMVELDTTMANDVVKQNQLRNILRLQNTEDRSGKVPVIAIVSDRQRQQFVRFGTQFRVKDDLLTVEALKKEGFIARTSQLVG
jgi:DNA polymerase III subunit alpha